MPPTIMPAKFFNLHKISKDIFYWENCFDDVKELLNDLNTIQSQININQWEFKKNSEMRKKVLKKMIICFNEYCNLNKIKKDDFWVSDQSIGFRYVAPNQGMEAHTDVMKMGNNVEIIPSFTMIAYLDNDYLGGEIFFEGIDIKPSAGSIVIFANSLHGVKEILSGHRTIVMQPLVSFKNYGYALSELRFSPFIEENF